MLRLPPERLAMTCAELMRHALSQAFRKVHNEMSDPKQPRKYTSKGRGLSGRQPPMSWFVYSRSLWVMKRPR